jgi:microcystin-dependent protein
MLFQSTAAPTGWTKDTTHNNKALRIVSGSVGTGGSLTFTSVFGSSISTNAHTLTSSDIPAHTHAAGTLAAAAHTHTESAFSPNATGYALPAGSTEGFVPTQTASGGGGSLTGTTGSTGSGGGHSHTMSMDLQYVDFIIATKD